ncbi:MAG TPA: AAA family ATPase [Gammaproteobacteria bacterium]|nr:AAA family ATPase [Gammaproteobacteria bacterium]
MYKNFFDINFLPFAIMPDVRFYCHLPSHDEAVNSIAYSIANGDSLITVTGEIGVGKTIVCKKVIRILEKENHICHIPNPSFSTNDFYRSILHLLGSQKAHKDSERYDLFQAIQEILITYRKQKKNVVVIIDEGQLMNAQMLESIRLLTNLELNNEKLIQIVLFGQPELAEQIERKDLRQFAQRIIFSYQIRRLSLEESNQYITHRLIQAGHTNGLMFSTKANKFLHKHSQGVPRIINILAHKAMMYAYSRNALQIDINAIKAAVKDSPNAISSIYYSDNNSSPSVITALTIIALSLSIFLIALVNLIGI